MTGGSITGDTAAASEDPARDVGIVGSGVAGLSIAFYARRRRRPWRASSASAT